MENQTTDNITLRKRIPSKVKKYQYNKELDQFEIEIEHDVDSSYLRSVQPCAIRFYNKKYYKISDEMRIKHGISLNDYLYFEMDQKRHEAKDNLTTTIFAFSKEKN